MSIRGWRDSRAFQLAFASLVLAVATTLWMLARALRDEPIPAAPVAEIASLDRIRAGVSRPVADIAAIADNDLFSIDRTAPSRPYRMPGDPDPSAPAAPLPEKPTVLGTAIATDGQHFATVRLGNGSPMLVRVGDTIGQWTVRSIERGKLVLATAAGQRAEVTVSKLGN